MKASRSNVRILTECAVMVAAAVVLSMIKLIPEMPFGGSVTLVSMAPIIIIAQRHGTMRGIGAAFVYSITQLLLGLQNFSYLTTPGAFVVCILFDYVLAFTALGLAGMTRRMKLAKSEAKSVFIAALVGTLIAVTLRFLCHLVSGAVIWHTLTLGWYAEDPSHFVHRYGPWMYSLIYNGSYMLLELILTAIAAPAIITRLRSMNR